MSLMAAFDGVRQAGLPVQIETVRPDRAADVRPGPSARPSRCSRPGCWPGTGRPFTGAAGADNPVVFAGFVVTNCETGCGASTVTPRLVAQVCSNGMTITRDAMRAVHLGERMDEGIQLVRRHPGPGPRPDHRQDHATRSTAFLDPGYVARLVREMEQHAGHRVADAPKAIEVIGARLRYTEAQQKEILDHFIARRDR